MNKLMASFSVRPASTDDVGRLAPLFDAYRRFYGRATDVKLARAFLAERLARSEAHLLLATDEGGEPLGFAQLYPIFSSRGCRRTLVLNDLCVALASRGLGVGRALLDHTHHQAKLLSAASISRQTVPDNRQARRLYERFGFVRDDHFLTYLLAVL